MSKRASLKLVVGLGKTGLSCIRYLKKQGMEVAVMDNRAEPPALTDFQKEFPDVPFVLGEFTDQWIVKTDEMIISPGVSLKNPVISKYLARGVPICGDIELFARVNKKPVLAITGSNGKTTLTTLLEQMVVAAGKTAKMCGNIGIPVLDLIGENEPDYYVMELSSFQLETTYTLNPAAAVVLNVSPDHMDRYDCYQDYVAAKQRVYLGCQTAIVNLDEPDIWQDLQLTKRIGFTFNQPQKGEFGLHQNAQHTFLAKGDELLLDVNEMQLKGRHHWQNALAALAVCRAIQLPLQPVLRVLEKFPGLEHRCQWIATKRGICWYNDSKGTNVGATIAALHTLGAEYTGRIFLIAGGDAKGADLTSLRVPASKYLKTAILLGKDAYRLDEVLKDVVDIYHVKTMEEAVHYASSNGQPGDAVLLSPACASFDMFKNYEHRGAVFQQLVERLPL